jgi:hypothetical protein
MATGSSTSGLIFVFAPLYALIAAGVMSAVVWLAVIAAGRLRVKGA